MPDLIDDSPVARKFRGQILGTAQPGEQVFFAADGLLRELFVDNWISYRGALVVTSRQLIVVVSKAFGRCFLYQVPWASVAETGRLQDGAVGIQRTDNPRRAIWELRIYQSENQSGPLAKSQLDLLALSIDEARAGVARDQAAAREANHNTAAASYEELRKRRGG